MANRKALALRLMVEKNDPAARLDQAAAGRDDRRRVGHVLQHLHAGDDVEAAGCSAASASTATSRYSTRGVAGLERVQLRHAQRLGGQVDAQHLGAAPRHRIGQDAAAAADVEHPLAAQADQGVDPVQAQRVDLVQRPELAFRVPPAVGQVAELGQFCRIGVDRSGRWFNGSREPQKKKPRRAGLFIPAKRRVGEAPYLARVPTTSISTRRFFARPSAVLLSATGCFSPLPSV